MSTFENTVSMMKTLPETDLLEIQKFTLKLFKQRRMDFPFSVKNREDIYRDLEKSRKQADEGECMEMEQALIEIREKYGL